VEFLTHPCSLKEKIAMVPLKIVSTGKALPSQRVTAAELDAKLGRPAGYTLDKGGVRERHFASAEETQGELGAKALHDALARGGLSTRSLDLVISACGVQQQALPSTACAIVAAAGLSEGVPGFDVNASCISFMVAMRVAAGLLNTGGFSRIAIVSSDLASRGVDWNEPEASLIFGDGAACAIVERGDARTGMEAYFLETYPEGREFCEIRAGGTRLNPRNGAQPSDFLFKMNGKAVFKLAQKVMPMHLRSLTAMARCTLDDIDVVVPHQASHLGMKHVAKKLGVPAERIIDIYETHGNQVGASIPTALHEAFITGKAVPGKRLMMLGTAAGLTVGGMILRL
jgi:3-oxoacyl-[acyl-carrier-protein] synthase-3